MSVTRQLNVISQMRLDVPHIRLIESGVAGDFDTIVGRGFAGSTGVVIRGFTIAGSAGSAANTLQLVTADGIAVNLNASESGSFLWVPPSRAAELLDGGTNGRVQGAFVPSAVNYVGIDFVRELDDSTIDLVKFKDPVTKAESDRLVPLGKTLNYKIIISTSPFSTMANVIPVAKVTVSSAGAATVITDARQLMFRLGSGGDVPDAQSSYNWPAGRIAGAFTGADKSFTSQKEWVDATMTRLWELGGGENWFSATADRNVHMTNYGSPFANGDYLTFDSGTGATSWQGIRFLFSGSTGTYNEVAAGSGIIADGQCLYVDLDRTQNRIDPGNPLVASIAALASLGTGTVPGSRWILAWRVGTSLYMRDWRYPVGTTFVPATNTAMGVVKLNAVSSTPLTPVVVAITTGGGVVVAATAGNTNGGLFEGFGNGYGVQGTGNGTGAGVYGTGTGDGVRGNADEYGVYGTGDFGGVYGIGRAAGVKGVIGQGNTTGSGVEGTGGATGIGVKGIGGTTSGIGVEGVATAGNSAGVKGTGQGSGDGVKGIGGATGTGVAGDGPVGVKGTSATTAAVKGVATGTAVGGAFTSVDTHAVTATGGTAGAGLVATGGSDGATGQAGVVGTGADAPVPGAGGVFAGGAAGAGGGIGVEGHGGANDGLGVYGIGGAGNGTGVAGFATGTGAGVQGTASSATEYGVKSVTGNVGAPIASQFKFTALKTGYHFVSITELQVMTSGGAAVIGTGIGAPGLPLGITHYSITNNASTAVRLVGTLHLPRGATITKVLLHIGNKSVGSTWNVNQPLIDLYGYGANDHTIMTKTSIVGAATVNVPTSGGQLAGTPGYWIPCVVAPVTLPSASTVIANSGTVHVDWDINTSNVDGTDVAGFMVEYTYQTVDFGI